VFSISDAHALWKARHQNSCEAEYQGHAFSFYFRLKEICQPEGTNSVKEKGALDQKTLCDDHLFLPGMTLQIGTKNYEKHNIIIKAEHSSTTKRLCFNS